MYALVNAYILYGIQHAFHLFFFQRYLSHQFPSILPVRCTGNVQLCLYTARNDSTSTSFFLIEKSDCKIV